MRHFTDFILLCIVILAAPAAMAEVTQHPLQQTFAYWADSLRQMKIGANQLVF